MESPNTNFFFGGHPALVGRLSFEGYLMGINWLHNPSLYAEHLRHLSYEIPAPEASEIVASAHLSMAYGSFNAYLSVESGAYLTDEERQTRTPEDLQRGLARLAIDAYRHSQDLIAQNPVLGTDRPSPFDDPQLFSKYQRLAAAPNPDPVRRLSIRDLSFGMPIHSDLLVDRQQSAPKALLTAR